jgi:hypothetical protein
MPEKESSRYPKPPSSKFALSDYWANCNIWWRYQICDLRRIVIYIISFVGVSGIKSMVSYVSGWSFPVPLKGALY